MDGGTVVLRKAFDGIHPPTKLAANLHSHNSALHDLLVRGILSKEQWELLFPPDGSKPDSKTFDITLLFLLLTEICGLSPPRTGWNNKPHTKNKTLVANLVRIKLFRNKLIHTPETRIDTQLFDELWKEISGVLVALGLSQVEIGRLKAERCGEEVYIDVLFKWADREKDIKSMVKEVRQGQDRTKQAVETVTQTQKEQNVLLQGTKQAVKTVSQTQQEQNVLLQGTKQAVETVSQTQQEQNVLLQGTKQAVKTVSETQQQHNALLQDTKEAVETVSQTHQEQNILLRGTKQAVETVSETQQEQNVLLQGTKKAAETVRQAQKEQHVILQDTNQAVQTVRQTQREHYNLLQDANTKLKEACQTQQVTESKVEAIHQTRTKTHEALEMVRMDLQEIKQTVTSLEEKKQRDREEEILQKLAKSEFKGDIEYHLGRFQKGTREWVFNKVQNWLNNRNSQNRVMVISADAGMGKSVISAVICQRMQEAGRLSGSHFCQHNNARYRNPQLMLQSLACHLCHALPEYKQALVKQLSRNLGKDLNIMGVEELFALLFKEPLSTVADPGRNMLMVIDGLDESEFQERNELLDVIANHFCKLPCWIRFLCTTRPERNIAVTLKQLKPFQLEPNKEDNMQDIKLFLEKKMHYVMRQDSNDTIVEKLVKKSEGLMLYAYFLVLFIEENLDKGDLDDSLPLAISSVYHSYFKRLEDELIKELDVKEENFLNLLCAVTASREPLPVGFVSKVLVPNANSPVARRKVLKAIGSVSSLLPVRDGCLHVIHKSVKDWLADTSCYGEHDFTVDEKEGHRILASLCSDELDYLKQKGVHETESSSPVKYALNHGVRHMLQSEENMASQSLEECVQTYVTDLELLYAKLCFNISVAAEDILWLQNQEISQELSEDSKDLLHTLKALLRKYFNTFTKYPRVFFGTVANKGGNVLSSVASNLLQNKYPEIPYMELVHNEMQQGAVLARFQCSSEVCCFDVSPQLDYMVCECKDDTIQLWSLHTGKLVWTRSVMVQKCHPYLNTARISPFSPVRSFYRSVVFHPTKKVVLPGVLSKAYTFDGDLIPLFPESNCRSTVCSVSGDKTKMLTNCLDDAKCIIMWSLKNGSEITRTTRNENVLSFAWSPDGKQLAISHSTGLISIVDAMDCFRTLIETVIPKVCGVIKFSPDCRSLFCMSKAVSSLHQKYFRLNINMAEFPSCTLHGCESYVPWDSESHSEAGFLLGDPISSGDSEFVFVLNEEIVLRGDIFYDFIDMLNISELRENDREATSMRIREIAFSLSGETVYVVGDATETTVSAWDVSSGELITETSIISAPYVLRDRLDCLVTVKGGVLLVTRSGTLELWSSELSQCVRNWTDINGITRMIPISEERVACEAKNEVIILDTTSGEIVSTIPTRRHEHLLAFNSKCQLLTNRASLQLSDGKTTIWTKHGWHPSVGVFSLSEQFVVIFLDEIGSIKSSVRVLDAISGKTLHIFREGYWQYFDCKFISDEECVISCRTFSRDYCLQLFNVKAFDLLSVLHLDSEANCLAACSRKRLLAIAQSDSKHGFKLFKVRLPQDEDIRKSKR